MWQNISYFLSSNYCSYLGHLCAKIKGLWSQILPFFPAVLSDRNIALKLACFDLWRPLKLCLERWSWLNSLPESCWTLTAALVIIKHTLSFPLCLSLSINLPIRSRRPPLSQEAFPYKCHRVIPHVEDLKFERLHTVIVIRQIKNNSFEFVWGGKLKAH